MHAVFCAWENGSTCRNDTVEILKGLAMIFAGQENPFNIFISKEIYIYSKKKYENPHKFAEIMKKNILKGTLTVFLIS